MLLVCKAAGDCPILPCPRRMLYPGVKVKSRHLALELLCLFEDIDLGTDLKSWSQLDVHGTHEVFLLQKQ